MNGVPLNIDWQQILLHLFNFVILFAILYLLLYKPIKNFMDKRKQAYLDMDNEANDKKAESEKLKSEYEEKLANANKEIANTKANILKDADEKAAKIISDADQKAEDIISKAKEKATAEKEKIVAEASDEITQIAKEAASKVIFGSTSEAYDSFLDSTKGNSNDK